MHYLPNFKQLWLSVLLKDTSVTAGTRTHTLLLTPELESGKLDRSATTLQILTYLLTYSKYLLTYLNLVILWQDLSLVGRWFQSLGAATEKDISPQVRFEVGSFRSDMLLERRLREGV